MKKIFYPIISAAAAVLLSSAAAQAQTASFLDVNPDPVAMSMAGTGTVMEATPFAMWNNIAATALDDRTLQVGAAYSLWQPSYTSNHVAAVAGYGRVARFMTVSASVKYFSHKPYDVTDGVTGAVTGSFTPMDLQAGVGLGFRILPILSLGANVNYVYSDIGGPKKAERYPLTSAPCSTSGSCGWDLPLPISVPSWITAERLLTVCRPTSSWV